MTAAANGAANRDRAPQRAPGTDTTVYTVAVWRTVMLSRALWLGFGVVGGAIVLLSIQARAFGGPVALRLLPGLAILTVGITWRRAPTWLRAWALLGGMQIAILGAALVTGYRTPNAFVGGLLLCVLAALVLDRRMAWSAVGMTVLVWSLVATRFVAGREPAGGTYADATLPTNWLRIISVYIFIAAAAVGAVRFLVERLERALKQREALYQALAIESEQRLAAVREQNELEARLQQSQKLEALGRLAGGVAHDFNNLLMVIMSNAELVARGDGDSELRTQAAVDIMATTERAAALSGQLLAFSRRQRQEEAPIDVAASVDSALTMLRRLLPSSIELRTELCLSLPNARGAGFGVEQILMNLCINARDAMPDGGELVVRTTVVHRAPPHATSERQRPYILLSVRDTGCGMDEQTQNHLFEPFFTTKPPGEGTGLGLSMVRGLARQSRGFVEFSSEPGGGTTFEVYLAVADQPPVQAHDTTRETAREPSTTIGGGKTVLVVDDDPGVRPVLVASLQRAGYRVIEAADGEDGLSRFREHAGEIALVVSDAIMPRMGGQAMHDAILHLEPNMRFLVCSGYTAEMFDDGFFERPHHAFLPKPFKPAALVEQVRALLDDGA